MTIAPFLLRVLTPLAGTALRGGANGRLSILIYHRVLAAADPLLDGEPDAAAFRAQMALLVSGFNTLRLSDAVERVQTGHLPPRAVCVTFDDGYRDNAETALPILKLGIPATFFIATGYLDRGRMFNDSVIEAIRQAPGGAIDLTGLGLGSHTLTDTASRKALIEHIVGEIKYRPARQRSAFAERIAEAAGVELPADLMMSFDQVREVSGAGMDIGGHTVTHPILREIPDEQAEREITRCREELAALTGQSPRIFAYPNGKPGRDYGPQHVRMVKSAGFAAAVSTAWGVSTRETDRYQLARFTPWDRTLPRFVLRLVQNGLRPLRHHTI